MWERQLQLLPAYMTELVPTRELILGKIAALKTSNCELTEELNGHLAQLATVREQLAIAIFALTRLGKPGLVMCRQQSDAKPKKTAEEMIAEFQSELPVGTEVVLTEVTPGGTRDFDWEDTQFRIVFPNQPAQASSNV